MAHVRFIRLDIKLFAGVVFYRPADLAEKRGLSVQLGGLVG